MFEIQSQNDPQQVVRITLTSPSGTLKLVPPAPEYDEDVAILRSHPEARKYLPFLPEHTTAKDIQERRISRAKVEANIDMYVLLIEDDFPPKFVGLSGIFNVDKYNGTCSAGICIHPDYFRTGMGTEVLYTLMKWAFEDEEYHMHRIAFETGVDNVMMRGWLEHVVGVKLEFCWREAWKAGPGKWVDVAGYSILETEWRNEVKERLEKKMQRSLNL